MISVILPTYNEKDNIILLIEELKKNITEQFEVIVIDDNSIDGTYNLVKNHFELDSNIKAILRTNTSGFASALQKGIDESKGDILIWMDTDFSHPPSLIPKMLEYLHKENFDAVIPSRFINGSVDNTVKSGGFIIKIHKLLSYILNSICSFVFSNKIHDWTSGFISIKSHFLKNHKVKGHYCEYFMEIGFHLILSNANIKEIPYLSPPRLHGESKSAPSFKKLFLQGIKYIRMFFYLKAQRHKVGENNKNYE